MLGGRPFIPPEAEPGRARVPGSSAILDVRELRNGYPKKLEKSDYRGRLHRESYTYDDSSARHEARIQF